MPIGLTSLKQLELQHNALLSLAGLQSLAGLTSLNLAGNRLTSLAGLALRAPALLQLDVSSNALRSLEGLGACSRLQELSAGHNRLAAGALGALAGCKKSLEVRRGAGRACGGHCCAGMGAALHHGSLAM
jgi:hypothetical protein